MKWISIIYTRSSRRNYFTGYQYLEDLYNNDIIRKRVLANKIVTYKFINLRKEC